MLTKLLQRLSRNPGDADAWEKLYRLLWPFVMATTFRILRGQQSLAEDASQDVFCRILRHCHFEDFKCPEDFYAYVSVVSRNVARDYLSRSITRTEDISADEQDRLLAVASDNFTPEQSARATELLDKILSGLEAEDQTLLKLIMEGYSVKEIARHFEIRYSNAAVRIHRFRTRLRKSLQELGILP